MGVKASLPMLLCTVLLTGSYNLVCHHPPISAFYLQDEKAGVSLNGHCKYLFISLQVNHILMDYILKVVKSLDSRVPVSRWNK